MCTDISFKNFIILLHFVDIDQQYFILVLQGVILQRYKLICFFYFLFCYCIFFFCFIPDNILSKPIVNKLI